MNVRVRFLLSIGLPVLLILAVVIAFLAQQHTNTPSSATTATPSKQWKGPLTPMSLALDWTPNTNHTGIYVALEKGWYRDQGINLKILPYAESTTPDTLVSTGKADIGVSSTESIVADAAVGQPVVSIAAIIQHNTSALVTLASSHLTRPGMLDGKVYGGFGAPYEGPVMSEVIKHDGGKGVIKNVTLSVDAMQALESHRIDFVWVYEGVEVIQAQRQGVKLNIFPITSYGIPDYYTPNLISSPAEIKQKPDLLRRFMVATQQGYEYAQTHAQDAAQALVKGTPVDTFPDQGLVLASQQFISPRYADAGRRWGWQDVAAWHTYPEFILAAGGVQDSAGKPVKSLNLDALYTNQFLR